MAEFEVGTQDNGTASYEQDVPVRDGLAREAGVINAVVDVNAGLDPFQRAQDPAYDAVQEYEDSLRKSRPQQLIEERSMVSGAGLETTEVDDKILQYQEDMSRGGLGINRQKVEEMTAGQVLSPETRRQAAFDQYYRMETASLTDDHSIGDYVADGAGYLLPFNETQVLVRTASELGFLDGFGEATMAMVEPGSTLERLQLMAQGLSPEDNAVFYKDVKESLDMKTDNDLIKTNILEMVFQQTDNKDALNFWNALDVADTALVAASLATATARLAKKGSVAMLQRKAPSVDTQRLLERMAQTPELAKEVGIKAADVADLYTPGIKGELGMRLVGASDEATARITAMVESENARLDLLRETVDREGILTPERRLEVMVEAEEDILSRGYPTDVEFVESPTGFTMKYKEEYYNPATNESTIVDVEETRDFTLADMGDVVADTLNDYKGSIVRLDPNARFQGRLRAELVAVPQAIQRAQGQSVAALQGALKDTYGRLNTAGKDELDAVLLKGSQQEKEFTYAELTGMGVSDKVKEAYFGQRNISYHLHAMENERKIEELMATGGRLVDTDEGDIVAKSYESAESSYRAYVDPNGDFDSYAINIMDDGFPGLKKGEVMEVGRTELDIDTVRLAERKGFSLVRNLYDNSYMKQGDNLTQWAFVRTDKIHSPKGRQVLNRLDGYVSKARTDSFFFVKGTKASPLKGARKGKEIETTVAWADNIQDAQRYADELGGEAKGYTVRFDRDLPPSVRDADIASAKGGLFGGKRKSTELKFVGSKDVFKEEGSFEMMQRYVNHVARQMPAHLWRLGTEQRFLERVRSLLPPEARVNNPHTAMQEAAKYLPKTSRDYKYLDDHYNQMAAINRVPTTDEQAFMEKLKNIGISLEGTKFEFLSKHFYRASQRNTNPADTIRGLTFTHMLGMFNPSQFLVQASGAFAAFSVNPVSAMKALPKTIGWQTLDAIAHDPLQQKRVADWMRSNGKAEYADSYMIWAKSGFKEAVTDANADFATLTGSKPYKASLVQRAMANNTLFYEMGELAMSRASVATAVEWYKDLNKVSKVDINDTNALQTIYNRAEQYRLNMGKANRSEMNKGLKAVPLQFQQVISKYFEKILPNNFGGTDEFTPAEKLRLFAIPTATFGIAAVPLGQAITEGVANIAGVDLTTADPETVELVRNGAMGWMMSEGGMHVNFTDRMSLPNDILGGLVEFAAGGGGNVAATLLGPSGNVVTRYTQAIQYVGTAFDVVTEMEDITTDEVQLMAKVMSDALSSLPSSTRSMRHYLPALIEGNDKFYRNGKLMWEWDNMNKQTATLAMWGFQPTEQVDIYDAVNRLRTSDRAESLQWVRRDADVITQLMSNAFHSDDPVEQKTNAKVVSALLRMHGPVSQTKLLDQVKRNMYNKQHDQRDIFFKVEQQARETMDTGLNFLNKMLATENQQFRGE